MTTINHAIVKHNKHKKGHFLHYGRLAPAVTDKQLLTALAQQYRVILVKIKGNMLHVQVGDKV